MPGRRIVWLTLLLLLALPGLALAEGANRAGLVIWYDDGQVEARCIAFAEDSISGADLLARSGLKVVMDSSSGLGVTVCQIEGWGCAYPAQSCFCRCLGGGECNYWTYFYRDPGETTWNYSALGAALRQVKPGSVEAWVWGDGHTMPADNLTFEVICALPTTVPTDTPPPLPTVPTLVATAPTASPFPTQTSPSPTTLPPTRPPAPTVVRAAGANPASDLFSYWPFGLMLLGLVLIGILVRLRHSH